MSLHQSDPLIDSLNHVARCVWTHSNLLSVAVQDGELIAVDCAVLCADRDPVRYVEDSPSPPDGSRMFPRPVQTLHPWRITGLGQNAAVGPPYRPETRSIAVAWLVSFMAFIFFRVWVPFPYTFFSPQITDVFPGVDFLRTVLWPVHLCLCPRRARLNWAARFWVPSCSCWFSLFC